ncbi:zinc ribbon domain-containing protein [Lentilactobacillus sunkii]|uniref:zinc ribbon domain-containing protein n=1 Tax=Lentilactobacillus sunkii TaxID=481719 RepID=UPI00070B55FF|nr:zinc ribbon domain-containing protein [Lentilactobacillus sunkii]
MTNKLFDRIVFWSGLTVGFVLHLSFFDGLFFYPLWLFVGHLIKSGMNFPDDSSSSATNNTQSQSNPAKLVTSNLNYCPKCGKLVESGDRYCPRCGEQLRQ